MSDATTPTSASLAVEGHQSHEIVRDEDVLSPALQRDLESVGTAIAVVAAVALMFTHTKRAAALLASVRAPASPAPPAPKTSEQPHG